MNSPSDRLVVTVTEVISDALETPVEELPPLCRVIDLDGLDRLVSSNENTCATDVTVLFKYAGLKVIVHSGGLVYAAPIDAEDETAFSKMNCDT